VTALFAEFSITNSPPGETARRNTGTAILLTDLIMPPGLRSAGFALCHAISIGQKRACYGLSAPREWASRVRADV
jgi:hypothetical protein